MKALALLAMLALTVPAFAASYKTGRTSGYKSTGSSSQSSGLSAQRQVSRGGGGFAGRMGTGPTASFGTRTLVGSTKGAAAPDVPGWLSNPQPGALIRSAGMGYKVSDGGPVHLNVDYAATHDWSSPIRPNDVYALYTTGIGVQQGPRDTPPYPANGGAGSGAGGNGIFAGAGLLGLNSQGQTVTVNGPGSGNGNGNGGSH